MISLSLFYLINDSTIYTFFLLIVWFFRLLHVFALIIVAIRIIKYFFNKNKTTRDKYLTIKAIVFQIETLIMRFFAITHFSKSYYATFINCWGVDHVNYEVVKYYYAPILIVGTSLFLITHLLINCFIDKKYIDIEEKGKSKKRIVFIIALAIITLVCSVITIFIGVPIFEDAAGWMMC